MHNNFSLYEIFFFLNTSYETLAPGEVLCSYSSHHMSLERMQMENELSHVFFSSKAFFLAWGLAGNFRIALPEMCPTYSVRKFFDF